jgi:hypothetical protein
MAKRKRQPEPEAPDAAPAAPEESAVAVAEEPTTLTAEIVADSPAARTEAEPVPTTPQDTAAEQWEAARADQLRQAAALLPPTSGPALPPSLLTFPEIWVRERCDSEMTLGKFYLPWADVRPLVAQGDKRRDDLLRQLAEDVKASDEHRRYLAAADRDRNKCFLALRAKATELARAAAKVVSDEWDAARTKAATDLDLTPRQLFEALIPIQTTHNHVCTWGDWQGDQVIEQLTGINPRAITLHPDVPLPRPGVVVPTPGNWSPA